MRFIQSFSTKSITSCDFDNDLFNNLGYLSVLSVLTQHTSKFKSV